MGLFSSAKPMPAAVLTPQPLRAAPAFTMADGVLLGKETRWNPCALPNAHIVAIGGSGSGKTQTLKALALALACEYPQTRLIIVDFHGDQDLHGETVFEFHRASSHGVNLLCVNLDEQGGGVSLQAIAVVRSLCKALKLGANQEGVLLNSLKGAYERREIFDDNPQTWRKEPPTFEDVRQVLAEDEGKEASKLLLKLATLLEYGIFSRVQPDWLSAHIVRLDVSKLPPALQSVAAESIAAQLMNTHRLLGEIDGKQPRTFLFVDEAKELKGSPSLDRIIADGRKYGLALVLASQSERHLSVDVIGNSSTKIVLPVDQTEVRAVARKFRFDENRVAALKPLHALCRFGTQAAEVAIWPYWERMLSNDA